MAKRILAAASLALCAACGGSSYSLTGTGTVSGTFSGQSMLTADAISNMVVQSNGSAAEILLSTKSNQCSAFNDHQALKSGQSVVLQFATISGNSIAAPAAGTYTINSSTGNTAIAEYLATDANCGITNLQRAASGTVTVASVAATGYGGSFDLTFGTDHVTGTFNSGTCSALGTVPTTCH